MLQTVPVESEEVVEHGEVDTTQQHGQRHDILLRVCVTFEAVVVDRKSSGRDIGEGDVDRVPHMHPVLPKDEDEQTCQQQVDAQSLLQRRGHGGGLLACVVSPGGLCGVEAVFVDAHRRHQSQHQQHDAKAAEPLCHAAPQEDGCREPLHGREDRRTRGGDA